MPSGPKRRMERDAPNRRSGGKSEEEAEGCADDEDVGRAVDEVESAGFEELAVAWLKGEK